MKEYPTISRSVVTNPIFAFDKLDGSNIRAEWNVKRGFYKFGKRHGLIDDSNPTLKKAPVLIQDIYGQKLDALFRRRKWAEVVAFFEFHGEHSAFGLHDPADTHTVTLIDVAVHRQGILPPDVFIQLVADAEVPSAAMLYQGVCDTAFINQVKDGRDTDRHDFRGRRLQRAVRQSEDAVDVQDQVGRLD